jgi:hypothetical protein
MIPSQQNMCKTEYLELIRFLGKHFHPSGASYNFALIPDRFIARTWSLGASTT